MRSSAEPWRVRDCDEELNQNVWGLMYIDELVQIAINQDPHNASSGYGGTENICERFFWVLQDANYNVLGVINPSGRLIERYEYTPYGQRTVYSHGGNIADLTNDGAVDIQDLTQLSAEWGTGNPASAADINGDGAVDIVDQTAVAANWYWKLPSDDPLVSMPRLESFRLRDGMSGSPLAPLCEQGHQGLAHDKEFALIYNRHRYLSPALGRFMQRDPMGYIDGMSLYEYVESTPDRGVDPMGLWMIERDGNPRATAMAHGGETVDDLPSGLESSEWRKWLRLSRPVILTYSGPRTKEQLESKDRICPREKVGIPNTVILLYGQTRWWEYPLAERCRVVGRSIASAFRKAGFLAAHFDVDSPAAFRSHVNGRPYLYGFFYGGHGAGFGYLVPGIRKGQGLLKPNEILLNHKVGYIALFACGSAQGWPNGWEKHIASGGHFDGCKREKLRWWHGFDFHVTIP